jgi:dUTPase
MRITTPGIHKIEAGNKIAQMIPIPVLTGEGVLQVEELNEAARGVNGFGSTGR